MREPQEGQQESREIEGRPIVFGVRSVNLTPWSSSRKVYEVLDPGCISRELLQKSDVVLNLNHSNMVPDVLGRYRNSEKDTLTLEMRGDGIDCRCELPRTNNANDTLELIRRGDIDGMSFAFEDDYEDTENGVSYERTKDVEDGKEVWLRHVKRITGLYDVAIVTHPAYKQTSVATREQSEAIDKAIELQLQREKEADNTNAEEAEDEAKRKEQEAKEAQEQSEREANGGETNAEKEARESAEREANGGETNAEKEAREAAEREANGGETNAEKEAREQRELEEQEQRFREQQAMRLRHRAMRLRTEQELESLSY